jgi:hypothetical protein
MKVDNLLLLLQGANESLINAHWSFPETNEIVSTNSVFSRVSSDPQSSPICAKFLSSVSLRTGSLDAPRSELDIDNSNMGTEMIQLHDSASKPVDIKRFAHSSRSAAELDVQRKWRTTERVCSSFTRPEVQPSKETSNTFVPAWKRKSMEEMEHLRVRRQAVQGFCSK